MARRDICPTPPAIASASRSNWRSSNESQNDDATLQLCESAALNRSVNTKGLIRRGCTSGNRA
jgi:hypothetical protein